MQEYLLAPDDPKAVIEKMASPACRIVSLTITEGGYFVHQGTGELRAHPDLQHDLRTPAPPAPPSACWPRRSTAAAPAGPGALHRPVLRQPAGERRHRQEDAPLLLGLRDPALHAWAGQKVAFPNAMVDRIVPATKDEHRALVREKFGVADGWPVVCEP